MGVRVPLTPESIRRGLPLFAMQLSLPQSELATFCQRNGIRSLALFGSFLHGDADENSDIDLLFEMEPDCRVGLLALGRMEMELSRMLGRKVDFVPRDGLKPLIRPQVLREARPIYPTETSLGET